MFGSLLNHVTDGRWATGALAVPPVCVLPKPASTGRCFYAASVEHVGSVAGTQHR